MAPLRSPLIVRSRRRLLLGALLASTALAAVWGLRARARGARAPVVLIVVDTLRADRLPAYGYQRIATPHLDALAADALLFERAYSHVPLTLPSHSTIFTGLLPPQHGARDNKGFFLADDNLTLAERLRAQGYRTGGFVSSMVLGRATHVDQGFETYDDGFADASKPTFTQRKGVETAALARRWVESVAGQPFFLFLHIFEPHSPHRAPEPYASRYPDAYDAEVAYSDDIVGGFLDSLKAAGLYDRSLVLMLSDHGEGLGDHLEQEHGIFLYNESVHVPLLVKLPGQARRGTRVPQPVGLMDVTPTILGFLGLARDGLPGRDLLTAPGGDERPLYSETFFPLNRYGWSPLKAVVSGRLHYIEAPQPELYDLDADPAERNNLLPGRRVPAAMYSTLSEIGKGRENTREVTAEQLQQLAALGYVGDVQPQPGAAGLSDPKDHIREAAELWSLIDQIGKPGSLQAERRVAELLEALRLRDERLARSVAINLVRGGAAPEAWRVLEPFGDQVDPATRVVLGETLAALGKLAQAEQQFRRALEVDGGNAKAQRGMGIVLLSAGRPQQARPWLERAVELDPKLPEAWNGLGVIRAQEGDAPGAVAALNKAVELDPSLADAWFNLALVLQKTGERRAAAQALERYLPLVTGQERARGAALLRQLKG